MGLLNSCTPCPGVPALYCALCKLTSLEVHLLLGKVTPGCLEPHYQLLIGPGHLQVEVNMQLNELNFASPHVHPCLVFLPPKATSALCSSNPWHLQQRCWFQIKPFPCLRTLSQASRCCSKLGCRQGAAGLKLPKLLPAAVQFLPLLQHYPQLCKHVRRKKHQTQP